MPLASRRSILQGGLFGVACACIAPQLAFAQKPSAPSPSGKYVCPPCGCAADGKEFDAPGQCPECGMPLVPKPAEPKPKDGASSSPKAGDSAGISATGAAPS
jgi:DNA-directed RNA polymerase subunit RPC12/RpoP